MSGGHGFDVFSHFGGDNIFLKKGIELGSGYLFEKIKIKIED